MAHAHDLRIQNLTVSNIALGTLAARTAAQLSSQFGTSLTRTFLIKKIKYALFISGITGGEGPFTAGLAPGDASLAEIAAAFDEINTVGPSDLTQERTQDNVWNVSQNSWVSFESKANATEAELHEEMPLKNGIPAREAQGVQLALFNHDGSALTTGAVVKGTVQLWGVWMK